MPIEDPKVLPEAIPVALADPPPAVAGGALPPAVVVARPPRPHRPWRPRRPRGRHVLGNAFRSAFLDRLDLRDEPDTGTAPENAGPWAVQPACLDGAAGYGVFHHWEVPGRQEPRVWFRAAWRAHLAALLLPMLGEAPWLTIADSGTARYSLELRGTGQVGVSTIFDPHLATALNAAECLLRSPAALAELLISAGPQAVAIVGEILASDLARGDGDDRDDGNNGNDGDGER